MKRDIKTGRLLSSSIWADALAAQPGEQDDKEMGK
jgi:hypothetical protein